MQPTTQQLNAAFILARYRPIIKAVARKLVRDRDKREDAAQEAAVRIINRLPRYDANRSGLSCWVYTVARSAVLDYLRKEQRAGDVLPLAAGEPDERPGREADPATTAVTTETIATSTRLRVIKYLAAHPSASKREVCRAIGCHRDTVRICRREMERRGFVFARKWSNQYRKAA